MVGDRFYCRVTARHPEISPHESKETCLARAREICKERKFDRVLGKFVDKNNFGCHWDI
jgi:hypothetical protein